MTSRTYIMDLDPTRELFSQAIDKVHNQDRYGDRLDMIDINEDMGEDVTSVYPVELEGGV